jgi:hypothetical protein
VGKKLNEASQYEEALNLIGSSRFNGCCDYRWVTGRLSDDGSVGRFLVPDEEPIFPSGPASDVTPDETLIEQLMDGALRENDFLQIAFHYGPLGVTQSRFESAETQETHGESFDAWCMEIEEFCGAYRMWEMVDKDNDTSVCLGLVARINDHLQHRLVSGIQYSISHDAANGFTAQIRACSPMAWAWLQLAEMACGARRIIRCEVCRKFMDVTDEKRPKAKRMHDKCGPVARMRRYRSKAK